MNRRESRRWLVGCLLTLIVLITALGGASPVAADDCTRDPLNAADCMRTPGFRQGITVALGGAAAAGVALVNTLAPPVSPPGTKPAPPSTQTEPGAGSGPAEQKSVTETAIPPKTDVPASTEAPPKPMEAQTPTGQPPPSSSWLSWDNFKRIGDYANKLHGLYDKFHLTPQAIERLKIASRFWRHMPSQATADMYIDAVRKRMNPGGKTGSRLGAAGYVLDAVDAHFKAQQVIQQRGYTGWEKAGAYYVEGANKVFVTMLTKNPVVAIVDQVAGDLTGHNIESTIRAGEEKWHQVTKEAADLYYGNQALDAEIETRTQATQMLRRIRHMIDTGQIDRQKGLAIAHRIYNRTFK